MIDKPELPGSGSPTTPALIEFLEQQAEITFLRAYAAEAEVARLASQLEETRKTRKERNADITNQ